VSQLEAAEVIAEDLIEQEPDEAAAKLMSVARSTPERSRVRPTGLLAAKAATEYVYVVEDVRRILVVGGGLLLVLLLLWVLLVPLGLIRI
jgi:hypothetical protein